MACSGLHQNRVKYKIDVLESIRNGISDAGVIYCADKQTFGAAIKVTIDANGCVLS